MPCRIIYETKYPKYYIDNLGNVYSTQHSNKLKKLNPGITKGYLVTNLTISKTKRVGIPVHRLIYETITNTIIPPNMYIRHKDGNKLNNSIWNLELVTIHDYRTM